MITVNQVCEYLSTFKYRYCGFDTDQGRAVNNVIEELNLARGSGLLPEDINGGDRSMEFNDDNNPIARASVHDVKSKWMVVQLADDERRNEAQTKILIDNFIQLINDSRSMFDGSGLLGISIVGEGRWIVDGYTDDLNAIGLARTGSVLVHS